MRFQVIQNLGGRYQILDTLTDKLCAYSGQACNPPKYAGEAACSSHEWNNWHSAYGFAIRLEVTNS